MLPALESTWRNVMDCGDAGHILLSTHVAEDLDQYGHWEPLLHDLGEREVKHEGSLASLTFGKEACRRAATPFA